MNTNTPSGPVAPARLFARLRWQLLRNTMRQVLGGSFMRPLTILMCSVIVWSFVFGVSYEGFVFLQKQQFDLSGGVVSMLFDMLFFSLAVLLVFSTGLILYSSLFSAAESPFLLALPAPDDQIFAFKYAGALAFSSWAFLLLGGPILIAYGLAVRAPAHFYLFLPLFFLGFVLLPGAVGAIFCLLIVNFMPQRRKHLLLGAVALVVLPLVISTYNAVSSVNTDAFTRDAVQNLLGRFDLARSPLLPSHWIAWGLRASGRDEPGIASYYLALVWSNGLFAYLLTAWLARKLYRRGYNRMATGGEQHRRPGGHWLDAMLERLLFPLSPQMRLLIVKDFRTFRRDPAQWAQILIFCILMVLYCLNIRKLFLRDITWQYQNGISLLNLTATALLLCTYTGRFIYPMLSLEGRKFWVLGLLPLEREKLLWGKFAFSTTGAVLIALTLVLVSDVMLQMPLLLILLHGLTVIVLAAGLSGLSVGLGACMPSFRETDPSKIAAGFGGTLNLVAGLGYLVAVVGLMAGPWHAFAAFEDDAVKSTVGLIVVAVGVLLGLAAGAAAVFIPLISGARHLRRMEF
jgi:ABC-2 type transport system permease protein